jgi:anti-sigma-K factor RskA
VNDLHALASEYAVGSLPASESSEFETHLATCPDCREEVAEMRDIAVQLSEAVATDPPPSLRASVLSQIAQLPQSPRTPVSQPQVVVAATAPSYAAAPAAPSNVVPLQRRSRATWMTGLVAAAAVIAAVALGGWAIQNRNDAHEAQARSTTLSSKLAAATTAAARLTEVLAAPDVKTASHTFATGGSGTVVLSASEGRALLLAKDLPALPSGKVYEAWTLKKHTVPAGTFVAGQNQTVLSLPSSTVDASAVAVTVEPAGGSQQPTTEPIFAVNLPRT